MSDVSSYIGTIIFAIPTDIKCDESSKVKALHYDIKALHNT